MRREIILMLVLACLALFAVGCQSAGEAVAAGYGRTHTQVSSIAPANLPNGETVSLISVNHRNGASILGYRNEISQPLLAGASHVYTNGAKVKVTKYTREAIGIRMDYPITPGAGEIGAGDGDFDDETTLDDFTEADMSIKPGPEVGPGPYTYVNGQVMSASTGMMYPLDQFTISIAGTDFVPEGLTPEGAGADIAIGAPATGTSGEISAAIGTGVEVVLGGWTPLQGNRYVWAATTPPTTPPPQGSNIGAGIWIPDGHGGWKMKDLSYEFPADRAPTTVQADMVVLSITAFNDRQVVLSTSSAQCTPGGQGGDIALSEDLQTGTIIVLPDDIGACPS